MRIEYNILLALLAQGSPEAEPRTDFDAHRGRMRSTGTDTVVHVHADPPVHPPP